MWLKQRHRDGAEVVRASIRGHSLVRIRFLEFVENYLDQRPGTNNVKRLMINIY